MPFWVHCPPRPPPKAGNFPFLCLILTSTGGQSAARSPPSLSRILGRSAPPNTPGAHSRRAGRGWGGPGGLLAPLGSSPWGEIAACGFGMGPGGEKQGEGETPNCCCSPKMTGQSGGIGAAPRAPEPARGCSVRASPLRPPFRARRPQIPAVFLRKNPGKTAKSGDANLGKERGGQRGSRGGPQALPTPPGPARAPPAPPVPLALTGRARAT